MMDTSSRFCRRAGIYALMALAALQGGQVAGHTWVDELTCATGPFSRNPTPGYIRGYVGRQSTNIDQLTTFRILDLSSKQMVCPPGKESPGQGAGFPKLKATPGDMIEVKYLENGHIWQTLDGVNGPNAQSGTIWIYGTQDPKPNRDIASVLKWNRAGTGGDKQGVLLDSMPFDDGTCAEIGHENAGGQNRPGGPCKNYFRIPKSAKTGKEYTVYWLWDYDMHFGPPKPGYIEWYSSCMDIDIVSGGKSRRSVKADIESEIEERSTEILPHDSAPVKGLNRHLRREQLREAKA